MAFAAAEGESGLTYTLCLDPTPCEVCKAGPCGGALDVVTLPTSEEHGTSNLRRKEKRPADEGQHPRTTGGVPGTYGGTSTPLLHAWQRISLKTDNLLSPGGGGVVLKNRELDLTTNMLVYLGEQSLL